MSLSHADFHRAARLVAPGRYITTQVEITDHQNDRIAPIDVRYRAYVSVRGPGGWTNAHETPEAAIEELKAILLAEPAEEAVAPPLDAAETLGDAKAEVAL